MSRRRHNGQTVDKRWRNSSKRSLAVLASSIDTYAAYLVNEEVIATRVWGDETEPLGGVEPDSASCVSATSEHTQALLLPAD